MGRKGETGWKWPKVYLKIYNLQKQLFRDLYYSCNNNIFVLIMETFIIYKKFYKKKCFAGPLSHAPIFSTRTKRDPLPDLPKHNKYLVPKYVLIL